MSFNAGDKVVCVDGDTARTLTQGKIYTVVGLWSDGVKVRNDFDGIGWYWPYRFKLAHKVEKKDLL